jgi:glutathione peroxidase
MKATKLKRTAIVILLALVGLSLYVEIINIHSKNMTVKQKILKAFYPALMGMSKLFGKKSAMQSNSSMVKPPVSFYSLRIANNRGDEIKFEDFKGKKVLLVNTASECGYTPQYHELQELFEQNKNNLVILGFPANDFGQQEKGTDQEIENFCKMNYGVSFPLAGKSSVIKGENQNRVFEWLTDKKENGWNEQPPTWNFSKYLVNEQGTLIRYFDPSLSPIGAEIQQAVRQ